MARSWPSASASSKQWVFVDALGSTIGMADSGSSTLARTYTYTPTAIRPPSGSGPSVDVQFAGGQRVGGLNHFGARFYDPATATWT